MELVDADVWERNQNGNGQQINDQVEIQCNARVGKKTVANEYGCFYMVGKRPPGTRISTIIFDDILQQRVGAVAENLGMTLDELKSAWFGKELPEIMGEYFPERDEEGWFTFEAFGDWHKDLGILTALDYLQRAPYIVWAYMSLRKRLPYEAAWNLFQLTHCLPLVSRYGRSIDGADFNKLNSISLFYGDGYGHTLHRVQSWTGEGTGILKSKPSFKEAIDGITESLNRDFFGDVLVSKFPSPETTWDEFAEWSSNYIKTGEI
jgi:hypothetical protein